MRRASQSVKVTVRHGDGVPQNVKDQAEHIGGAACGLCADTWLFETREAAVRFSVFARDAGCSLEY